MTALPCRHDSSSRPARSGPAVPWGDGQDDRGRYSFAIHITPWRHIVLPVRGHYESTWMTGTDTDLCRDVARNVSHLHPHLARHRLYVLFTTAVL